jgi:HEAT repeat protein
MSILSRRRILGFAALLLLIIPGARAEDDAAESPEDRAKRLKVVAGDVKQRLLSVLAADVVSRGNALEGIADVGQELKELQVEGLVEKVRKSGLTAKHRFISVLAGEILAIVDPEGTLKWLDGAAFSGNKSPQRRRAGLAILSEIPLKKAGKMAATYATNGSVETRVQALIALGKLREPGTYGAMIKALGANNQSIKDNAALALGKLGDPRAVPALLGHLEDATGNHSAFAAWALGRFDHPSIFKFVVDRLSTDSGETGDAKARVLESSARLGDMSVLRGILRNSRSTKYRYAAALAIGRLAKDDLDAQKFLLTGLMKERNQRVRAACFFGLSKNASPELGAQIVKGLKTYSRAKKSDQNWVLRSLAFLAGDLKLEAAGSMLLRVAMTQKNELNWRIAAVNFWRCRSRGAVKKLKEEFSKATQGPAVLRMAEIFGRSKGEQEFRYLCDQLRRFTPKSPNSFAVELALETMTGHFFGPEYGMWRLWFRNNPDAFKPRTYRIDRRKWQKEFGQKDREFRQTPATERAVQLGLAWLSRHVNDQGALNPNRFFEKCCMEPSCKKTGSRFMLDNVGCTSLASLALLGGGYSPDSGKYKDTIRRLLDYIEVRQTVDGTYSTTDMFRGYQRPIAIYALAEAYNITGDDRYEPYLRRGIDFLIEIQNELGGWHYQEVARETDTSVMSWVLLGLGVAHKSGFHVRESVFEGCDLILDTYSERVVAEREKYVDIDPHYGFEVGSSFQGEYQTGYQSKVSENATTAFGLLSRMFLGWRRSHPFCIGSARFILAHKQEKLPPNERWEKYVSKNRFPSYAWYYGTLAMHQMGGRYFRSWNAVIRDLLPGLQLKEGCDAGAWPVLGYDYVAGKIYTTCMGILTLETYYRYKPFCEEGLPEEEEDDK